MILFSPVAKNRWLYLVLGQYTLMSLIMKQHFACDIYRLSVLSNTDALKATCRPAWKRYDGTVTIGTPQTELLSRNSRMGRKPSSLGLAAVSPRGALQAPCQASRLHKVDTNKLLCDLFYVLCRHLTYCAPEGGSGI